MGFLSSLFGSFGDDTSRENYPGTQRQSDGGEYEKRGDIVIRHTEDTQAHTTWHCGSQSDGDSQPTVRCVNVYDDSGTLEKRAEYDEDGNKINA